MKKEYETARLFKNNRASDCLSTEEELCDSDQQQSTKPINNSTGTTQTSNCSENAKKSSLPQRFLVFLQRVITVLGLDHKG